MAGANRGEVRIVQEMLGLRPAPHLPPELQDVVLVCIDCEAFEFDQSKVTEVGVSVLDTSKIRPLDAGHHNAEACFSHMVSAHYRISEYAKYKNRRWVKGCEDHFAFGESTWIRLGDASSVLTRVFEDPGNLSPADRSGSHVDTARNVVLVGHGLGNDSDYLDHLNFSLQGVRNVVRKVDTATIAGSSRQVGLKRLLVAVGLAPEFLHNAGNDAAYTLQALLLVAFKEHEDPGSVAAALQNRPKEHSSTDVSAAHPNSVASTSASHSAVAHRPSTHKARRARKRAARAEVRAAAFEGTGTGVHVETSLRQTSSKQETGEG